MRVKDIESDQEHFPSNGQQLSFELYDDALSRGLCVTACLQLFVLGGNETCLSYRNNISQQYAQDFVAALKRLPIEVVSDIFVL